MANNNGKATQAEKQLAEAEAKLKAAADNVNKLGKQRDENGAAIAAIDKELEEKAPLLATSKPDDAVERDIQRLVGRRVNLNILLGHIDKEITKANEAHANAQAEVTKWAEVVYNERTAAEQAQLEAALQQAQAREAKLVKELTLAERERAVAWNALNEFRKAHQNHAMRNVQRLAGPDATFQPGPAAARAEPSRL